MFNCDSFWHGLQEEVGDVMRLMQVLFSSDLKTVEKIIKSLHPPFIMAK